MSVGGIRVARKTLKKPMRKSAASLKKQPVKLSKLSLDFIAQVEAMPVEPGTEKQHEAYVQACIELEEADTRAQILADKVDKLGPSDPAWPAFDAALHELQKAQKRCFGMTDGFVYATNHINDAVMVPEEDLRAIANDSLADKLDELQFSVNYGLLASKVAQSIRKDAAEGDAGNPPFCGDCQGG